MRALRLTLGVVAGIVLANLVVYGWEWLLLQLPFGMAAPAEEGGFIDALPLAAQGWIAGGWMIGAFAGALLAFRAARWDYAGWIVAGAVAASCIAGLLMIPYPLWMQIWAVAGPFVGALFAFGVYRRLRAADLHLSRG